jgi:CRP-like cAMP-binding protein
MGADVEFLRKVPLFEDLADDELGEVAAFFRERKYAKNNVVFLENETGDYMYMVREGRVKVVLQLPSGKETILAFHDAGEFFGEMSLIDGGTTPATVMTVEPSVIYSVSRRDFRNLLQFPAVNEAMMRILCLRCRDAWAQVELLTLQHADARIRAVLLRLSQQRGERTEQGVAIPRLAHRELADMAGITRESASRALSKLQKDGLLEVAGDRLRLADPEQLIVVDDA